MQASLTISNGNGENRDRLQELATVTSKPSEENRRSLRIPENLTHLGAFETFYRILWNRAPDSDLDVA